MTVLFNPGQSWAVLQLGHITEDRDGSGFDAAVIAIDGLVAADCSVLELIGLLLGGE